MLMLGRLHPCHRAGSGAAIESARWPGDWLVVARIRRQMTGRPWPAGQCPGTSRQLADRQGDDQGIHWRRPGAPSTGLEFALLQRMGAIGMPVFAANGDSDPMIPPHYSYLLAGLIPHGRVKIYPDSAHGFLFQHHAEFAADVDAFLTGAS
jgi:pimeloyl-ACP methyl ester carboxylesterase